MTDLLQPKAIGQDHARRDGPSKVSGTAPYANEAPVDNPAYCHLIQADVARGRVTATDAAEAEATPGVLAVLTPRNVERLASTEDKELAVLQTDEVAFRGQIVGLVIAETPEVARQAAGLVSFTYAEQPHDVTLSADRDDLYKPDTVNPSFATDTSTGDVDAAMQAADVTVTQTYSTAMYHNNPMEPHATTALWNDGDLVLWDSTQGVHSVRSTVAKVLGLAKEQVRVICPYVGGGFGSKGMPHAHVIAAAMGARALPGRAVKLALTRQQMFSLVGYRTPTIQRVRLAAAKDGRLSAIALDVVEQTSRIKEFAEQTAVAARMMYAAAHRATSHRLAALDVPVPSWMRAPGECPGMFGPEVAMDELAERLGIDPVELRIRNEPERDPESGNPFSSRNLVTCLRDGAERFGWADRDPRPGARRDGGWLVGTGVASSVYPASRMPKSDATVRFEDGRYVAEIGAADLGTGTWTTLALIAADALGVPADEVDVRIGDTEQPFASVAGGSSGTSTWGTAIVEAARAFRDKFGQDPQDGDEAQGQVPEYRASERYALYAFGAQFAEVRVHADTGEIRVPRLAGVFAAGRVVNPRTARSQLIGGMTMGMSMALHENSVLDPATGHVVNHDFAEYHIATCADAANIEAYWVDEHDPHVNPMGSKGIGEIGIVGTAAAIANAAYHATGVRVRDLPVTLDKLLPGLD
ncbi:xanthine dehydrogenase family protein molybdopterin-binding subunit [Kibdelosporangium phytohabitans]|uniref:Xanthine dehydrogenase n=1 Tax=Kibdelosporangium phytohabitans TaxID=860235 RepID=A0A0N9I3N2_9PSEU|nr:xanthine dehydrogenase family protein molybdopterin-binding subunit [Kibdelosporangium phytohabitans]ALG09379.1 xanthine dehydrogenase [Kibdelosporangium phytohabitans]MBE1469352.1 xanthine dehydrogenase YagR molybdenum-binding subunit [Kibdelosporangium phytohabitans]